MTRHFLSVAPLAPADLTVLLLAARVIASGKMAFTFLAWNLVLAAVPLFLAKPLAFAIEARRWLFAVAVGVPWLLFLPNAPYLVTDLVHLRVRQGVPYWFDVALLGAAALAGLTLGVGALSRVETAVRAAVGQVAALGLVVAASLASGFGIWLGRFGRFNSWDFFTSPSQLVSHTMAPLLSPTRHPQAIGVTLVFAAVFASAYFAVGPRQHGAFKSPA